MGGKVKLAPSILNADFSNLGAVIKAVEPYADYIHLDVMDGHFVPNITFGPMVVRAVREITTVPLDCHLMIYNPPEWVETFAESGADRIAIHLRACREVESLIQAIGALGVSPGLAISPEVPLFELKPFLGVIDFVVVMCVFPGFGGQELMPEMLNRVGAIKREAAEMGTEVEVEVDGGVKTHNLSEVTKAGTDTVVIGSSIFGSSDISAAAADIKAVLDNQSQDELRAAGGSSGSQRRKQ